MKYILLLLVLAFCAPILMNATLFNPAMGAIPELTPWTLMLLGFAGSAVCVRAPRKTAVAA